MYMLRKKHYSATWSWTWSSAVMLALLDVEKPGGLNIATCYSKRIDVSSVKRLRHSFAIHMGMTGSTRLYGDVWGLEMQTVWDSTQNSLLVQGSSGLFVVSGSFKPKAARKRSSQQAYLVAE